MPTITARPEGDTRRHAATGCAQIARVRPMTLSTSMRAREQERFQRRIAVIASKLTHAVVGWRCSSVLSLPPGTLGPLSGMSIEGPETMAPPEGGHHGSSAHLKASAGQPAQRRRHRLTCRTIGGYDRTSTGAAKASTTACQLACNRAHLGHHRISAPQYPGAHLSTASRALTRQNVCSLDVPNQNQKGEEQWLTRTRISGPT